jgi:hypothetical protein
MSALWAAISRLAADAALPASNVATSGINAPETAAVVATGGLARRLAQRRAQAGQALTATGTRNAGVQREAAASVPTTNRARPRQQSSQPASMRAISAAHLLGSLADGVKGGDGGHGSRSH